MRAPDKFCVYLHKRPDDSVFYVGKGVIGRAYDFSPSRRTLWHKNVVAKYGRAAIRIEVIPCASEDDALRLEREKISALRAAGVELTNLTDGGEGCAGRVPTEAQLVALAKGRVVGKRGVCGPRPQLTKWQQTDAGKAHLVASGKAGTERLHALRTIACCECGRESETRSAKARFCSRLCEQRNRRARQA